MRLFQKKVASPLAKGRPRNPAIPMLRRLHLWYASDNKMSIILQHAQSTPIMRSYLRRRRHQPAVVLVANAHKKKTSR